MTTGMLVESPVRGDSHAGFGGRPAETEQPKGRHRAAGRPYLATKALDEVRREHWNELRHAGQADTAKQFNEDTTQDPPRWLPGDGADRAATTPVGGPPA